MSRSPSPLQIPWPQRLLLWALKVMPVLVPAVGGLVALLLALRAGWFFFGLGIASLAVVLVLTEARFSRKRIWQFARDFLLNSFLLWIVLWLLLIAVIFILMTLDWKPRAARFAVLSFHGPSSEVVGALIPRLVLVSADPVTAVIRLHRLNTGPSHPVTITISLPAGLQAEALDPQEITTVLSPEAPSLRLSLRGRATVEGFWSTQALILRLQNATGATREYQVPIQVEGGWMAALRQALEEWLGGESLLSLGIALASAIGGLALQYAREQAERKLRLQERAHQMLDEFRRSFESRDFITARNRMEELKSLEWKDFISSTDIERMERLMQAVEGRLSDQQLETLLQEIAIWQKAAAVVFLQVAPLISLQQRQALRQRLREDQLPPTLRDEIAGLDRLPLGPQPLRWPPSEERPLREPAFEHLPQALRRRLNGIDPFPASRAEEERDRLLNPKRPAFWPHPIYERLVDSESPALVVGPSGSGRTATARALARLLHPRLQQDLILYRSEGIRRPDDLWGSFARLILRFLLDHPTYLTTMDPIERSFAARLLKAALLSDIVETKVASALSRLEDARWLRETQNPEQKLLWLQQARHGLSQFLWEIEKAGAIRIPPEAWPEAIIQCARTIGFQRVRLILDLENPTVADLATSLLSVASDEPMTDRLGWIVFLPHIPPRENSFVNQMQMFWDEDQLRRMIDHRYRMIIGEHRTVEEVIDSRALDMLVEYALQDPREGAPGRTGRLWRTVLKTVPPDREQITEEDVEKALRDPRF